MSSNTNFLSAPSPKKLYSKEAFQKATRVERIFIYLIMGGELSSYRLTEAEKQYQQLMEKAYHLLFTHRSRRETIKILRQSCPAGSKQMTAPKVLADAELLYGRFEEVDRKVQRGIIREALVQRIAHLEEWIDDHNAHGSETDPRTVVAAEKTLLGYWKQLSDLDALNKPDVEAKTFKPVPEIVFTNDAAVLTEDVEHEEME